MSVQNALKLIRKYREKPENRVALEDLKHFSDASAQENLSCSVEELKKAFKIDWNMRWLKFPDMDMLPLFGDRFNKN